MRKVTIWTGSILMLCFGLRLNAQTYVTFSVSQAPELMADAGTDDIICPGDTVALGGMPAASGGTPAYTYAWTPSGDLDNGAASNPMAFPGATTTYTLTVTDDNNCTSLSTVTITVDTCVGIPDPALPIDLVVYPNPSLGQFTVTLNGNYAGTDLVLNVLNPVGQVVESRKLPPLSGQIKAEFGLDRLSKGVYLVELNAGDQRFVRKVIIQ